MERSAIGVFVSETAARRSRRATAGTGEALAV